jgi:hypothetical protein
LVKKLRNAAQIKFFTVHEREKNGNETCLQNSGNYVDPYSVLGLREHFIKYGTYGIYLGIGLKAQLLFLN